jgi:penicillin amidase
MLARTLRAIVRGAVPRTFPALDVRHLPPVRGRLEVIRDANGVAHCYAADERDLFAALGYLQGADRFPMIDLLRHLGAGRLAELVGDVAAPRRVAAGKRVSDVDAFMRPLELAARCAEDCERLGARARAALGAFADGVNAALGAMAGCYPAEYLVLGEVRAWTAADALLAARTCAFVVSLTAFENELTFDAVRGRHGDGLARRLYPDAPWEDVPASYDVSGPVAEPAPPLEVLGVGSNNWAVAGSRSASGAPVVGNDPHVPFIPLPTFWHHVHVETPRYRAQGGMFPGCPAFGFGHNGSLAWGVTTGFRDGWDLYRIHRLPDDPTRYRTPNGPAEIVRQCEVLRLRGGRERPIEWERCAHGILYPGWRHHDGVELAVRYVSADAAAWFEGHLAQMEAQTVADYRAALERINEGPFDFNHVYAHKDGHIAWELIGRLPKRAADGLFVRDADDPKAQWDGFVPFAEMPKMINPARGFVASANSIVDPRQVRPIATPVHFEPRYRQDRIERVLAQESAHSTATFTALQSEIVAEYAPAERDALLRWLGERGGPALDDARALLAAWDGRFTADSGAAALFFVTRLELARRAFGALLGPGIGARYANGRRAFPRLRELLLAPDDPLRSDIERAAGKPLGDLVAEALGAAVHRVRQLAGEHPAQWQWGRVHRIRMGTLLSFVPGVGRFFLALNEPCPGDEYTVNPSRPVELRGRFYALVGATSRFVCDLARPEEALFAHTSGPSGDVGSTCYADLAARWYRFEYFRSALWKPEEVPEPVERVVAGPS